MNKTLIETIVGVGVLLVAAGFALFAIREGGVAPSGGYRLDAKFANATGIAAGSDVRIGGIKVGVVSDMTLDAKTYEADLAMQLDDAVKIPSDSSAAIVSAGLLGSKFLEIVPGGMDEMLEDGGTIQYTQSSVNLESLIGKMVHSGGGVDEGSAPAEEDLGYGKSGLDSVTVPDVPVTSDAERSGVPSLN